MHRRGHAAPPSATGCRWPGTRHLALSPPISRSPRSHDGTESWTPNVAAATRRLHPRGVVVVATSEDGPLPFTDEAFDLVVSRRPVRPRFDEIARLLVPGGSYARSSGWSPPSASRPTVTASGHCTRRSKPRGASSTGRCNGSIAQQSRCTGRDSIIVGSVFMAAHGSLSSSRQRRRTSRFGDQLILASCRPLARQPVRGRRGYG